MFPRMNRLKATVSAIESEGTLSLVDLTTAGGIHVSALLLESPASNPALQVGGEVTVAFKETEVSIATGPTDGLSLRNLLPSHVVSIDVGRILAKLVLDCLGERVVSVITSRSAKRLGLEVGDRVTGLVKANEVSILWKG